MSESTNNNTGLIEEIVDAFKKVSDKMKQIITLEKLTSLSTDELTTILKTLNEQLLSVNTITGEAVVEGATEQGAVGATVEAAVGATVAPVVEEAQEGGSIRRKRKTKKGKKRKTRRKTIGKGKKSRK